MYPQREIKEQWYRCWSYQFITNLDEEDGEGEDRPFRVMGKERGCPWPCPSVLPPDKGSPNPWSGLT